MQLQEEILFRRWRESLPTDEQQSFVSDGVVDALVYKLSTLKILFLLKEVNDAGGGGWCLREFLRNGGRPETWDVVTRWVRAIRNPKINFPWDAIRNVTEAQRCEALRSIAVMNLKKIPGGHTTDVRFWWPTVNRDQEYVREQFAIYGADLVVCCGSDVRIAFDNYVKTAGAPEWERTLRGVEYLQHGHQKFVVAYSHPEARIAANLLHYGLIDAIHEILYRNPGLLALTSA